MVILYMISVFIYPLNTVSMYGTIHVLMTV